MGYLVAHFRKVKTAAGLGNVAQHNSRGNVIDETGGWRDPANLPPWLIHPERITHNEGQEGKRDDSIIRMWHRAVKEAELKRKPQRNAAAAVEAVFSASPGSIQKASDWKAYFEDCREWVDEKFGHQNVLQWNTHYDEKTPHLHVLLIPIVRDPERGNKYSSAEFLGGREGLREIQNQLHEKVGKKYGLDRGVDGSKARHTNQAEWEAKRERELNEEKEKLIKATNAVMEVHKMNPLEVLEMKKRQTRWDAMSPSELKQYAGYIEAQGFKTVGDHRRAAEAKKLAQERSQERGRSR